MVPRFVPVWSVALLMLDMCGLAARAQTAGESNPQSGYTFQANSRVVLTDVTVTDKKGNPVHGLKASDFRILDNNKPEEIISFEEQRKENAAPSPQPVLAPGVYSNDYLKHPPRVLNILFLDLTNIEIADQMYLNYQLGKFFDMLKPGDPVAIYARPGSTSILLQGFTADRGLLRTAVRKAMPRFPPLGRDSMDDLETLNQIAAYLGQIPGRKNVLWFSGGSALFLRPDGRLLADEWRTIFDELEAQRIAIYPIDVRGLTVANYPINARGQTVVTRNGMLAQHALMSDVAEATGGHAVYDNNGLAQVATRIVENDGEYYTLTYSPHQFAYNNKWHQVRVTVPGTNYTLSYRRGYFADGSDPMQQTPGRSRTRLKTGGSTEVISTNRAPIVFEAQIHPGMPTGVVSGNGKRVPHKGTLPYTIEYSLPLDAFEIKRVDGKWKVDCGAEIIALNSYGSVISHVAKQITFTLREEAALHPAGQDLPLEEEIDLTKGDVYVYVAVFDRGSKRLGSMEIPYRVDVSKQTKDPRASK